MLRGLFFMGAWCNGSMAVSKTADEGSNPSAPANFRKEYMHAAIDDY